MTIEVTNTGPNWCVKCDASGYVESPIANATYEGKPCEFKAIYPDCGGSGSKSKSQVEAKPEGTMLDAGGTDEEKNAMLNKMLTQAGSRRMYETAEIVSNMAALGLRVENENREFTFVEVEAMFRCMTAALCHLNFTVLRLMTEDRT